MITQDPPPPVRVPSVWLLGIASGLSPFGMAIIVPALGSIAEQYDASFASVQFLISAYVFGLAIAQPVSGFLCDRFGRRPVMLTGFALFVLASIACILAESLTFLVVARFAQAIGVSVGTVASRAILRDTRTDEQMAEAMSYISAMMGIAPALAPAIGGILDSSIGYKPIFLVSALMGLVVFLGMYWRLTETLPRSYARPRLGEWFRGYKTLLRSPSFVGNTLIFGAVQGAFFAFIAVGAAVFLSAFGIDSAMFGIIWGSMAFVYIAGATIAARLTPIVGIDAIMRFAILMNVVAALLIVIGASVGVLTLTKLLLPIALLMGLAGMITPGSLAGAVRDHATIAGTAAGLSSAIGLVLTGLFALVSGTLYDGSYGPTAWLMFAASLIAAAGWVLSKVRPQ